MYQQSFKTFVVIWIGQLVSIIGTSLTSFGIGVWVLKETGSITQFSLIMMSATVPAILISPFAGVVVDRWKRKWVMVISDSLAGLSTIAIFLLLLSNSLEIWHIYIAAAVASFSSAFQSPAYQSSISLMVPKAQLIRANGMVQLAEASSIVIAPLLAGFLVVEVGIKGIIMIDFVTFLVAITILLFTKLPEVNQKKETSEQLSFFRDALYGWKYIMDRPGLKGLLVFFAVSNLLLGFFNVLLQPLILSFTNEKVLGAILSFAGIGMLVGGIVVSVWGGSKKRILTVMISGVMGGLFLSLTGIKPSPYVVAIGAFMMFLLIPFANGASQTIWQSKVAPNVQGRVFALRRMIGISLSPVAYVTAGPLVEKVFEPFMQGSGKVTTMVQSIIGSGNGRGMGLFIVLVGVVWTVSTFIILVHPRVRHIESELPDEIDEGRSVNQSSSVHTADATN
ncbi:MFS transporter [Fredinandcohnia sp. 179-A 10B2 NHS]|uniref:MFS transporter n=1 Tax=Fredinandcohnia sp. 179-A 10B2 NHS TaxID=3235176 RepID=UPI00399F7A0B